jgi:hypothetical protein
MAAETAALETAARCAAEIQTETDAARTRVPIQLRNHWMGKAKQLAAVEKGRYQRAGDWVKASVMSHPAKAP